MSNKYLTATWEHSPYRDNTLLVHLALADSASLDGHVWSGINMRKLAELSRLDIRNARVHIATLVREGYVTEQQRPGKPSAYTLRLCEPGDRRPTDEELSAATRTPDGSIRGPWFADAPRTAASGGPRTAASGVPGRQHPGSTIVPHISPKEPGERALVRAGVSTAEKEATAEPEPLTRPDMPQAPQGLGTYSHMLAWGRSREGRAWMLAHHFEYERKQANGYKLEMLSQIRAGYYYWLREHWPGAEFRT